MSNLEPNNRIIKKNEQENQNWPFSNSNQLKNSELRTQKMKENKPNSSPVITKQTNKQIYKPMAVNREQAIQEIKHNKNSKTKVN